MTQLPLAIFGALEVLIDHVRYRRGTPHTPKLPFSAGTWKEDATRRVATSKRQKTGGYDSTLIWASATKGPSPRAPPPPHWVAVSRNRNLGAELHRTLLDRLGKADRIDWEWASLDSASVPAPGGQKTGANTTDKGKSGSKRHVVVDREGIPLSVIHSAANVHDSKVLQEAVDAIEPIRRPRGRQRKRPQKLHADKAYDFPR